MNRKNLRIKVDVRMDQPAHPLDDRIVELARELRRLVHRRSGDIRAQKMAGKPKSPEHRAKILAAAKARGAPRPAGWHHTDEAKQKIAAARRGKKPSEEARWNMSQAYRARQQRQGVRDPYMELVFGQGRPPSE